MECNDFESRTLIQFCKFHQLLVTVYMMLSSSFAASGLEEIMDSVSTDEVKNIQIVIIVDGTVLNKFQHLIQV